MRHKPGDRADEPAARLAAVRDADLLQVVTDCHSGTHAAVGLVQRDRQSSESQALTSL